ncbi:MAG TPA: protein kinase, partial [Chloroflexota bacterium]|nr:protein kinase [Chloroflexota bacterium]
MNGESLATWLRRSGRQPPAPATLALIEQTALALSAIHEAGAVHGNLKPSNVMIVPELPLDRVVITDLGLSLSVDASGARSSGFSLKQTPFYGAPEQIAGDEATPRTDVYALGLLMYELSTGRFPFSRDGTPTERRSPKSFPRPTEIVPDLPPKWEAAIMRCLETDPAARFASPTEAVEALGTPSSIHPRSRRSLRPDGNVENGVTVETLVMTDLLESTRLVGKLGDARAAEVFARHDRVARDLLLDGGTEIDRTDGFLLMFDRPSTAVTFAIKYHKKLRELSTELGVNLAARVGIHIGEVRLRQNSHEDVLRGAKPIEVEGLSKPVVARLTSLATGGQTLMTKAAFDVAKRASVGAEPDGVRLRWASHGRYEARGLEEPLDVFEVGVDDETPFVAPPDSDKARRIPSESRNRRTSVVIGSATLAIVAAIGGGAIWLQNPGIPRPLASRRLTSAPGWEAEPAISPDGTLVAYASDEKGPSDIWIVDIRGTSMLRLTDDPAEDRTPAWFPDNESLAFASNRGGSWGIWRVPRLGGSPNLLIDNALDPAISADGKRIAFARPTTASSKSFTIWVAPLDNTQHATMITTEREGFDSHRHPAWRPDGSEIAFEDWQHISLVPVTGGKSRALTTN